MPRNRVREQDTPQLYTHRDLRSRTHASDRLRKQSQKYYGYRGVNPTWVGETYLDLHVVSDVPPFCLGNGYNEPLIYATLPIEKGNIIRAAELYGYSFDYEVVERTWTKRDMFNDRACDILPLDRRHHHSKRKYCRWGFKRSQQDRGQTMKQKQRLLPWVYSVNDRGSPDTFVSQDQEYTDFNFNNDLDQYAGGQMVLALAQSLCDPGLPGALDYDSQMGMDSEGHDALLEWNDFESQMKQRLLMHIEGRTEDGCSDTDFEIVSVVSEDEGWHHIAAQEGDKPWIDSDSDSEFELVAA